MSDTPAAWPDQSKPGVPLNPERDGWHWLALSDGTPLLYQWLPDAEGPYHGDWYPPGVRWCADIKHIRQYRYAGPIMTPAEVAAIEKAAYQRGWSDREADFVAGVKRTGMVVVERDELRAMDDALRRSVTITDDCAAAVAKARRAALEEAARVAEGKAKGYRSVELIASRIQSYDIETKSRRGYEISEEIAAAIRALAEKEPGNE